MPGMTAALLALALTAGAAIVLFARRRRRRAVAGSLAPLPLPAGMKALANNVGSLSSLGMHLSIPSQRQGWRRLGTLLGIH
jgi:hypothetical protein